MRFLVLGSVNLTILTTNIIAKVFQRVLYDADQSNMLTFLCIVFVVLDVVTTCLDVTRSNLSPSWSIVSVALDMIFFSMFALYCIYYKARLIAILKRDHQPSSELSRISSTLILSIPATIAFIISYAVFLTQRSTLQYTFGSLTSALMAVNLIGLSNVLSLRPNCSNDSSRQLQMHILVKQ